MHCIDKAYISVSAFDIRAFYNKFSSFPKFIANFFWTYILIFIEVDGGYRESHGYMGIGVSLYVDGNLTAQISRSIRGGSSIDAEMMAIAHALKLAVLVGAKEVYLATDCRSCIDILNNNVKSTKVRKILSKTINSIREANPRFKLIWMGRDSVSTAHELSFLAMERYRKILGFPGLK